MPITSKMVYTTPAKKLFEALPIGNGQMGAFIYGDPLDDLIHLTETTFWSGDGHCQNLHPGALHNLKPIREALFAGKRIQAEIRATRFLTGKKGNYGTNLPFGKIILHWSDPDMIGQSWTNYQRTLALNQAVAELVYTIKDITFHREYFASNPHQLIAIRFFASKSAAISFTVVFEPFEEHRIRGFYLRRLKGKRFDKTQVKQSSNGNDTLQIAVPARESMHSDGKCGVLGSMIVKVIPTGGTTRIEQNIIRVDKADEVILYLIIRTDFDGMDPLKESRDLLERALRTQFFQIKQDHIEDFGRLFNRVELRLGTVPEVQKSIPELRDMYKAGSRNPEFVALLFQYGRYLLLSSSRANSILPASLQGVCNDNQACRMGWTDDYHLDINTQMNYWPAESCNLTETTPPLFSFLRRLSNAGEKTAKELYGCRGWVAHTVTNVWGFTAPGWHLSWGMHPTGGAWLALHLWEHYAYNLDTTFLRDTAYPILKKTAEFFLDYLVPHPQYGWLVAGPSNSPENIYRDDSHQHHFIDMGVTCDRVLIYDIFRACISASYILDHDEAFRAQLETTIVKLSPFQIGKNGRLQEWLLDYEDVHPEHRHTCHLLALYPGDQIDVRITPELAQAARKTIDLRRIQKHWEGTGWSYGNFLGYYARLGDGEKAWDDIGHVVNDITAPNLLICHPALAGAQNYIYELDGNTGFTAAIAEILLQSHLHEVRILPALPQAWTEGAVIGLCARGGFVVDISWKYGNLTRVTILSRSGSPLTLRYKEKVIEIQTQAQKIYVWDGNLNRIP